MFKQICYKIGMWTMAITLIPIIFSPYIIIQLLIWKEYIKLLIAIPIIFCFGCYAYFLNLNLKK